MIRLLKSLEFQIRCLIALGLLMSSGLWMDRSSAVFAQSTGESANAFCGGCVGGSGYSGCEQKNGECSNDCCDDCCDDCPVDCCDGGWLDYFTVFAGIEGSKQPQDLGVNANLGGRASANWAVPVSSNYNLGFQLGAALNNTGNAVRVYELLGENSGRVQTFTTVGFFQRLDSGWNWGFVWDYLYEESFDTFDLSQWRVRVGYWLNDQNEVGATGHIADRPDVGLFNGVTPIQVKSISQVSGYWRRIWESNVQTTIWTGLADGHGESNIVTGFSPPQGTVFVFGADIFAPLNDYLAIYGETNLMMPADTGTVDAFLGFEWFFGGGAYQARQRRYSPVLPVAGSTSFSVDARF